VHLFSGFVPPAAVQIDASMVGVARPARVCRVSGVARDRSESVKDLAFEKLQVF